MPKQITFSNTHPYEHLAGKTFEFFRISWDDDESDNFRKNGASWVSDPQGPFWGYIHPLTKGITRIGNRDGVSPLKYHKEFSFFSIEDVPAAVDISVKSKVELGTPTMSVEKEVPVADEEE